MPIDRMVSSPEPLPAASGMLVQPSRAATVCEVDRARKRAASCNRARTSDLGYRNSPRSLTHARMNTLLTQSSPCEVAEGEVVEQRAPTAVPLDRSARHHDAVVGLELNLRFTRNDGIDEICASRRVPFGRVKDCAAAIRAAGRDHQRGVAGEARVALAELIESEPDRF